MLCSLNCFTKTVGIINYILRKQMMVQGTARSSETYMLYLSESVTNHVIFRRFPYNLIFISNGFVSSKIYDKRDDFDFDIVNFPFWDGDVPRSTSYGVYISQLIRFARVSSHVANFNARNKSLTAKLLHQGYRYHKLRKTFSKFLLPTL